MKQVHLSGEKLFVDYRGLIIPIINHITVTASIKSILDKKLYLQKAANNNITSINIFNNHENIHGNIYK